MNSFHDHWKVMIAMAAAAGFTCGTMMYHQVCSADRPSILADSSSSRGRVFMCWVMRKMKNAPPNHAGTHMGLSVLYQPSFRQMTNAGIIVTCAGSIIV